MFHTRLHNAQAHPPHYFNFRSHPCSFLRIIFYGFVTKIKYTPGKSIVFKEIGTINLLKILHSEYVDQNSKKDEERTRLACHYKYKSIWHISGGWYMKADICTHYTQTSYIKPISSSSFDSTTQVFTVLENF